MRKNLEKTWKNRQNLKKPGKWARAFSRSLHIKNFSRAFGARQFQQSFSHDCGCNLAFENVALADISSDMTLEIEVIIILELTRNRNLENLCEKHGKTWKISVKNLEKTWKIRQTNLENEVNCVV